MWFSTRREEMKWRMPILLGSLTWLFSTLMYGGNLNGMIMGFIYGLAVVGVVQYADRGQLSGTSLFEKGGLVARRLFLGYLFFGLQVAVTALFWWVAAWFGGSYQTEQPVVASPYPFLLPLAFAVAPALFEELVYRRFADVWLTRLTGSVWVAAIVSSLFWSFTHLSDVVSPWYLRIIELSLVIGPLVFWLYRRYGVLPAVVSHFLYNVFMYDTMLVGQFGWSYGWTFAYLLLPLLLLLLPKWDKGKGLLD